MVVRRYLSATVLRAAGFEQFIATTPDDFIAKARYWADHLPELAELRATARDRMDRSPLCDCARFTRELEDAYRAMWRTWCERPIRP